MAEMFVSSISGMTRIAEYLNGLRSGLSIVKKETWTHEELVAFLDNAITYVQSIDTEEPMRITHEG